ncbi:type II toxin-antitoxin system RelE/ParE family toxin [Bathymodiolus platifrons methanotrophic gill symbiont]|uniref:type II toxin-antitoxin system RelE/ParE family toxin n=1 Tax=Bathymodiolus platifrons methanotrophic gill symbiont TaxID=113268 RepID=UPI0021E180C7|nr:type II toxin-antitoxin system RelE/ParE family toxin [Bathymodiolus platifrons methanotrophic gill symbiont]
MGDALVALRPSQLRKKPCSVKTTSKGDRKGIFSITVNGNWRVTFEFVDGNAFILNYEDYH